MWWYKNANLVPQDFYIYYRGIDKTKIIEVVIKLISIYFPPEFLRLKTLRSKQFGKDMGAV